MTDIAEAFRRYTESRASSPLLVGICELAGRDDLNRPSLDSLCESLSADLLDAKPELVDVVLYCVRLALADHDLSESELENIRYLKRLFRIKEGDIQELQPEEVAELLTGQMTVILADKNVDPAEQLEKVRLQEAFDLGYDQFLEITRPLVRQIVEAMWQNPAHGDWKFADFEERLRALDTVYPRRPHVDAMAAPAFEALAEVREILDRLSGEPSATSGRSRTISQEVQDRVWRRDQGRCVQCASNEDLEFDHIIPFARGGSNTYRNVQLLCEPCNRSKSDNIG